MPTTAAALAAFQAQRARAKTAAASSRNAPTSYAIIGECVPQPQPQAAFHSTQNATHSRHNPRIHSTQGQENDDGDRPMLSPA